MRHFVEVATFATVVAATLVSSTATGFYDNTPVTQINEGNIINFFSDLSVEPGFVLVEFYAPWCSHCKKFKDEYVLAATKLQEKNLTAAAVNCESDGFICELYGISSFPTVLVLGRNWTEEGDSPRKQDILSTYTGELHHLAVLDYLRDEHEVVRELVELENVNAATNFVGSSYAAAILFAADSAKAERAAAKMAAAFHDDIPFATTSDEGVAAHYGVKPPALVVFRAKPQVSESGSDLLHFTGELTNDKAIDSFVMRHKYPRVSFYSSSLVKKDVFKQSTLHVFVYIDPKYKNTGALLNILYGAEKIFETSPLDPYFIVTHVLRTNREIMYRHNVHNAGDGDCIVVSIRVSNKKTLKYKNPLTDTTSAEDIATFVKECVEGKREEARFLSSLPAPPEALNKEMDVRVVVASTWDKEVVEASKTKDVLLLQYATWCRGSKWTMPHYLNVAKHFADDEGIAVVKMDSDYNEVEHEGAVAPSLPRIKLFGRGQAPANPYLMVETPDAPSIIKFVEEWRGREEKEEL